MQMAIRRCVFSSSVSLFISSFHGVLSGFTHRFLLFSSPCSETQGAGQTQTETQEDLHGHVTLPRPSKHHGQGEGTPALLITLFELNCY